MTYTESSGTLNSSIPYHQISDDFWWENHINTVCSKAIFSQTAETGRNFLRWFTVFLHCCHWASVWIRMCCLAPQSHSITVR